MIAAKFGGTSLADAACIRRVAQIVRANPERRYVVVSAPGKRYPTDIKITDQLYRFHASGKAEDFKPIEDRFNEIIRELGLDMDLSADYEEIKGEPHNADYIASCGEYLSARIMAAYLEWPFVDAEFCVFFDENGQLDTAATEAALREKTKDLSCAVLPGYYGAMPDGQIRTFSRGGSDISGALVASALKADVYENWTDVSGMLTADPRTVPEAAVIPTITYAELEEMARSGASVLHQEAVRPVWDAGIPIHICNTFDPDAEGTWIGTEAVASDRTVTGIAGRRDCCVLAMKADDIDRCIARSAAFLRKNKAAVRYVKRENDSVSLVVSGLGDADARSGIIAELERTVEAKCMSVKEGIAVIAAVGSAILDCASAAETFADALAGFEEIEGLEDVRGCGMRLTMGVKDECFEDCLRALYRAFFG